MWVIADAILKFPEPCMFQDFYGKPMHGVDFLLCAFASSIPAVLPCCSQQLCFLDISVLWCASDAPRLIDASDITATERYVLEGD